MQKIRDSLSLMWRNLGLFSAIILTVWLPGNLLAHYAAHIEPWRDPDMVYARYSVFIVNVFGPIHIAAMFFSLERIREGLPVTYLEAMGTGIRKWMPLLVAQWIASLIIILGLIGFIVPGITVALRYALIGPVVVLEGKSFNEARKRSIELTVGHRWGIFQAVALFYAAFLALIVGLYLPMELFSPFDSVWMEIALDCALDVFLGVLQIVLFLFYWDAIRAESSDASSRHDEFEFAGAPEAEES